MSDGIAEIPIEERNGDEVKWISGRTVENEVVAVDVTPKGSPVANPAFDVTPARLVTGLITERGVCVASYEGLAELYPEQAGQKIR
jgi:methylthioribose-1-phosphate isomerase